MDASVAAGRSMLLRQLRGACHKSRCPGWHRPPVPTPQVRWATTTIEPVASPKIIAKGEDLPKLASLGIATSSARPEEEALRVQSHYFDSYRLVTSLEGSTFRHAQAIAIMKTIRALLVNRIEITKAQLLSQTYSESESYLFRAAMAELRTEIQSLRRNQAVALRQEIVLLQRNLEVLEQQMREDLSNMRNDVTMEVENRKAATRAEQKAMELKIQELNNHLTKRLGDMRTAAEAHKWRLTRMMVSK